MQKSNCCFFKVIYKQVFKYKYNYFYYQNYEVALKFISVYLTSKIKQNKLFKFWYLNKKEIIVSGVTDKVVREDKRTRSNNYVLKKKIEIKNCNFNT